MKGGGTNFVEKEYKDFVKKWEMILHELGKYGKLRPVIQIVKKSQIETSKKLLKRDRES